MCIRDSLTASLTGNYTGSMLVGHSAGSGVEDPVAVHTPRFMEVNMKLAYDLSLIHILVVVVPIVIVAARQGKRDGQ